MFSGGLQSACAHYTVPPEMPPCGGHVACRPARSKEKWTGDPGAPRAQRAPPRRLPARCPGDEFMNATCNWSRPQSSLQPRRVPALPAPPAYMHVVSPVPAQGKAIACPSTPACIPTWARPRVSGGATGRGIAAGVQSAADWPGSGVVDAAVDMGGYGPPAHGLSHEHGEEWHGLGVGNHTALGEHVVAVLAACAGIARHM